MIAENESSQPQNETVSQENAEQKELLVELQAKSLDLTETVSYWQSKCSKLEAGRQDYARLLNEQSQLMKALNVSSKFNYIVLASCAIASSIILISKITKPK